MGIRRTITASGLLLAGCLMYSLLLTGAGMILRRPADAPVVTVSLPARESREVVLFPYTVPELQVLVEELVLYDGPFLEKGGEEPASDITALMVQNTGQKDLLHLRIVLETEERLLVFQGSFIPSGGRVILLEESAAPWKEYLCWDCTGTAIPLESTTGDICLEEREADVLAVTNASSEACTDIRIYYKNYLAASDVYVGGVTYCAKIAALAPGETTLLTCKRYLSGYSRVVRVESE